MLVGREKADGLSQEGAGSERRADWLREAIGKGLDSEPAGVRPLLLVAT
jgi:hypothetical protein